MHARMLRSLLLPLALAIPLLTAQAGETPPESQGFSPERLARIAPAMQAEIAKGTIPGAVTLIARNGQIAHFEAHGFIDAAKTRPMTRDALFRGFSMTKPLASVAAMILVEEGRLSLRDPIANWMPEFKTMQVMTEIRDDQGRTSRVTVPAKAAITVHDLLRHTAGFVYPAAAPFPELKEALEKGDAEARAGEISSAEYIKRLSQIPLAYEPGTRWEYSFATDVLGVLVERVSGKRLDQYLAEMVFKPLQMKDAGFYVSPEQRPRLADALDSDRLKKPFWEAAPVEVDPARRYRLGASGGVFTAEDYFRFAQMMLNGGQLDGVRILSRKTAGFMMSDHVQGLPGTLAQVAGPGYGFGLGFAVRLQEGGAQAPGSMGDANWGGAGGTSFTIDPKEKIVGVFLSAAPSIRPHTRLLFKNMLYAALVE